MLLLDQQVCSLDLAKRLHELEVKQESLFYWGQRTFPFDDWMVLQVSGIAPVGCKATDIECVSAFTASELLESLPSEIIHGVDKYGLSIEKYCDTYITRYNTYIIDGDDLRNNHLIEKPSKSLSNSLAKTRIYLIEQGIVKP